MVVNAKSNYLKKPNDFTSALFLGEKLLSFSFLFWGVENVSNKAGEIEQGFSYVAQVHFAFPNITNDLCAIKTLKFITSPTP